nr:unnamed protein product [Digitaria exilis]
MASPSVLRGQDGGLNVLQAGVHARGRVVARRHRRQRREAAALTPALLVSAARRYWVTKDVEKVVCVLRPDSTSRTSASRSTRRCLWGPGRVWLLPVPPYGAQQQLAAPHFAHGGETSWTQDPTSRGGSICMLAGSTLPRGEVRSVRISEPGTEVAYCKSGCSDIRTFAYCKSVFTRLIARRI